MVIIKKAEVCNWLSFADAFQSIASYYYCKFRDDVRSWPRFCDFGADTLIITMHAKQTH